MAGRSFSRSPAPAPKRRKIVFKPDRRNLQADQRSSVKKTAKRVSPDPLSQLTDLLSIDDDSNYELLDKLGSGAYGEVWRAKKEDHQDVAIKRMLLSRDPSTIIAEITHLQSSNHPNIPKYYSSFRVDQQVWVAMEFIQGLDAQQLVHKVSLSPSCVATVIHGTLSALQYLHQKSIIHRDVKADNVLVKQDGHVFLSDFGLCIGEGPNLRRIGTPGFMAPEVLLATTYNAKEDAWSTYNSAADVWSVGMTMVQMATRKAPYFNCNVFEIKHKVINNIRPEVSEDMPHDMDDFVDACLIYDPTKRATAAQLLQYEYIQKKATPDQLSTAVKEALGPTQRSHSESHSGSQSSCTSPSHRNCSCCSCSRSHHSHCTCSHSHCTCSHSRCTCFSCSCSH